MGSSLVLRIRIKPKPKSEKATYIIDIKKIIDENSIYGDTGFCGFFVENFGGQWF